MRRSFGTQTHEMARTEEQCRYHFSSKNYNTRYITSRSYIYTGLYTRPLPLPRYRDFDLPAHQCAPLDDTPPSTPSLLIFRSLMPRAVIFSRHFTRHFISPIFVTIAHVNRCQRDRRTPGQSRHAHNSHLSTDRVAPGSQPYIHMALYHDSMMRPPYHASAFSAVAITLKKRPRSTHYLAGPSSTSVVSFHDGILGLAGFADIRQTCYNTNATSPFEASHHRQAIITPCIHFVSRAATATNAAEEILFIEKPILLPPPNEKYRP